MYSLKVMSDKEFEALPYKDTETALGIADPESNTAYVRFTGLKEVDKYLINHELDHLIDGMKGEHSDHYRNGVYYKDWGKSMARIGQVAGPVMMMIPGMQPIGLATTIGSNVGQGVIDQKAARAAQDQYGSQQYGQQNYGMGSPLTAFGQPAAPNVVAPGGMGGQQGGLMSKLMSKLQSIFNQRSMGNYATRDPYDYQTMSSPSLGGLM